MTSVTQKNFIMFGPPNCGKGTQSEILAPKYGIKQIAIGDILRDNVKKGTKLGLKAKEYMDAGKLAPDEIIIPLLGEYINGPDCRHGFILDGFPRTKPQGEALLKLIKEQNIPITGVFFINISEELSVNRAVGRWMCRVCNGSRNTMYDKEFARIVEKYNKGEITKILHDKKGCSGEMYKRADDNENTARDRFQTYTQKTKPVYQQLSTELPHLEIDGDQPLQDITNQIIDFVEKSENKN